MKNCKHINGTDMGYGFARASGWRGLGVYQACNDCGLVLEFSEDEPTPEEIEHNQKKREAMKNENTTNGIESSCTI